jgi:3-oxoacyl-[acyl-carrier-protein] synthase II
MGSAERQYAYYEHIIGKQTVSGLRGTAFFSVMGHTCAANLAVYLGVTGRVMAPMSACTSASQSLGAGFEAIRYGMQDVMVCGGADEAHFTAAATFDTVGGTSCGFHDAPEQTPRPFDLRRDGLVVGAGSGILVLEALDHAIARGATPLAELIGYATTCDGSHVSPPQREGMVASIRLALGDAGLAPDDVGYINAHATATPIGDPVEASAMREIFGDRVPVSSTKGHTAHTLGACGAIESVFTILMLRGGFLAATRNLEQVDPECDGLHHLPAVLERQVEVGLNNNFAFGGVNTSLVFTTFG